MAVVAEWKKKEVEDLKGMILEYPVVGIVDMMGIPAKQLQKMRELLREDVVIKMSRRNLMLHAIDKAAKEEKSLEPLKEHVGGQPAFIFSKMNPFKLYKVLERNRTTAPAKPNSIAPSDISVEKGPTGFPAGPILGELHQAGIPATIEKGKIEITKDAVVVKEGQKIAPNVASVLARLGIEPMEIGLDVLCAYEDGTVFMPETLAVDESKIIADIQKAYRQAVNLSVNTAYPTRQTMTLLIAKAAREASALAVEATIFEPEVMGTLLSKAHAQMMALAQQLKEDALDDDLKEKVSSKPPTQAPAPAAAGEEKEAEEEPDEETSEEEAAEGLGALFG